LPPKREPDATDKLTVFALRQEMAQRKSLVELLHRPGIEPCDDAAPCADQQPAKAGSDILANAGNSSTRRG
jgi:hypothetical protein